MIFKERLVHFLEESSEKLKLTYQSTLQSIQIINVIDTLHRIDINKAIAKQWTKAKCFAIALLRLCCKLFEVKSIHMRDFIKLIEKRYQDFAVEDLEKQSIHAQDREAEMSCAQIEQEIKEFQIKIVIWLRWKVSMPLLYDDVIMIAYAWDNFTLALSDFPLMFQSLPSSACCLQNHNYLVNSIRICLYNFNHLIKNTSVQNLSHKIHNISISIFITAIKFLMKEKIKQNKYAINPKISVNFVLQDFLRKQFHIVLENMQEEVTKVLEVLNSYKLFKEKSKSKKDPKLKDDARKKINKDSKKHSEDKENIMYYVNRARSRSRPLIQHPDCHAQQSRSKSKKDKTKQSTENIRFTKKLETKEKMPKHKNKSNSSKSITSKNISLVKRDKSNDEKEAKKEKKTVKCNMSNASKHTDKSHLTSKITPLAQNYLTMKTAYWLQSTTLAKTDKKSTNSSLRIKIR